MNRATVLKVVLLLVGVSVFGVGVYRRDPNVRRAGVGFLAAGFLLRLATSARASRELDRDR